MTERTVTKKSWADNDSDSISLTSTKESEVDEDAAYVVDRILAEAEDDDDEKSYLIRWEGYNLLKSTWEPAENIQMHETFDEWEAEKDRIKRGDARPFDMSDFNRQLRDQMYAKEERQKRRRAKRKRLGISVSPYDSDLEENPGAIKQDDAGSTDEGGEVRKQTEDVSGLSSSAKRAALNPSFRQDVDTNQDESDISEDSLLEELTQKALKRPSLGVLKQTGKPKQERDSRVSPSLESPSGHDPSLPTESCKVEASRPRRRGEAFSRTGYKGTANRGSSSSGPVSRGRGRPVTRGLNQNRGRGANAGSVNFTGIKSTAEGQAKQRRGLAHAILKAPKSNASNQTDHFKTLSMIRKAELGGRALADRAPDMESVGPLRAPAEYGGTRPSRNKPQGTTMEELKKTSKSETSHRKSLSPIVQALAGQMMEDDQVVFHEEPGTVSRDVETYRRNSEPGVNLPSAGVESQNQPSPGTYLETGSITTSAARSISRESGSNTPTSVELNATSGDLSECNTVGQNLSQRGQSQKVAGRKEVIRPGLAEQTAKQVMPITCTETSSGPTKPSAIKEKPQKTQRPPSKSVTKMRLSEYTSRRASDLFGHAISVQAIFGGKSAQLPIAFAETNKYSEQPWMLTLRDIRTVSFIKALIAQDLEPQAKILNTSFLARGNVITDSSGALALEEIAENLRPCLGLLFEHSTFNILIFPARCEEWKFLEIPNADPDAVLRYHIYSQPCAVAINCISPKVESINEHLVSLVELSQGLKYKSLVPRCTDGEDVHNFYLLFPEKASSFANLLAIWLRACNPEIRIFTHQKPGSWSMFCNSSVVKSGAMIIHSSFVPLIAKIPSIERLLSGKAPFNFWCFDDGGSENFFSSLDGEGFKMVRLFPHGGAVMLTPSFLLTQPQRTHELLVWFQAKLTTSTKGTWKLVLPYDCRQYFLDLADQKIAQGEPVNICKFWFLSHQILDKLMRDEFMEGYPYCGRSDDPDKEECSIVYADQSIKPDDEIELASWYAGWTMLHLNHFRKFIIVGTKIFQEVPHTHERKIIARGSGTVHLELGSSGASVPAKDDVQGITPKHPLEKWKRNAFATVADSSSNAEQEPFIPAPINDARTSPGLRADNQREQEGILESLSADLGDTKRTPRPSHGIDETLNESILRFIVITGANREDAERFLNMYGGDVDVATRNYFSSTKISSSLPCIPQLDGSHIDDPTPLLDFNTSSDVTSTVEFQYLHLGLEDVQRAKELYRAAHEPSISPSRGPANYDGADENEGLSREPPAMRSGAVVDEITKRKFIPTTIRPSGSVRSEINIRTDYVAPEDRPVYKNRRVVAGMPKYEVGERANAEGGSMNSNPMQSQSIPETEQDGVDGNNLQFTEWYKVFKKKHGAWEHIYVGPWDECFKILRVKSKV